MNQISKVHRMTGRRNAAKPDELKLEKRHLVSFTQADGAKVAQAAKDSGLFISDYLRAVVLERVNGVDTLVGGGS